jgi:hypothetical protein
MLRGRMVGIYDFDRCGLDGWMAGKSRSQKRRVPGPGAVNVGGGMNADKSIATFDESLEGRALVAVERIAGRLQEHNGVEGRQLSIIKKRWILARNDAKAVLRAEVLNRGDAWSDRIVPKSSRSRINDNV